MKKYFVNYDKMKLLKDKSDSSNRYTSDGCWVNEKGEWVSNKDEIKSTVYWGAGGKSYHNSKECTALKRSTDIKSGTLSDAQAKGKTDPCNLCVK